MESPSFIDLTFIGGGVLATSIVDGLEEYSKTAASDMVRYNIRITTRRDENARALQERYPDLLITTNNRDQRLWQRPLSSDSGDGTYNRTGTASSRSIFFICTQPQFTSVVCEDIRSAMKMWSKVSCPIVVTMCPGITIQQLGTWLKQQLPIVRTMPNTPVSEKQGATAMFANSLVSDHDMQQVINVFRPISPAVCLLPREDLIDVAACVSG
nr:delta-1-pyrroline-5-carboxylate reductase apf3 [Quercus suber]